MNWPASPESILRFVAAVAAVLVARTAWRRREVPGSLPFAGLMLAAAWWALFSGMEYAHPEVAWRVGWSKVQYLGITTITPCWFLFALQYSQKDRAWDSRVDVPRPYLFLIPAITILLVFTNELHGLIWSSVAPIQGPNGPDVQFNHGLGFWVFWIYSYTLLVAGTLLLVNAIARFPPLYRSQAIALIVGLFIPWIANLVYVLGIPPLGNTDLTPVAFVLCGVVFAISAFQFYLFDVVPIAQDAVIESITDGVIVSNAQRRIVYANPAVRQMLKIDQWVGQPAQQALSAYPQLLEAIPNLEAGSCEIKLDGEPPRCIELTVSTVRGPRGEMNGRVVILRDVTERKVDEEQRRLQSIAMEAVSSGIVITNRQGSVQWINPAFSQITGYTLAEIAGQDLSVLRSGRQTPEFYTDLWQTINLGQVWSGEMTNRRKDGALYIQGQTISPVRDPASGEITHFIGVSQDITARKDLEQMRDDLMRALVHDLRNPLNSILLTLDVFKILPEPVELPEAVSLMLEIGRESALRMTTMVNAILDISKLESGQMPVQPEAVILAEVVELAFGQQAALASRSEILLLNGVPYDLPPLWADPGMLNRVFQNLLDNALKFTPNGGTVEVSAGYDPRRAEVQVSVKDNGPGIPEAILARVFEKYVSQDANRRGTGLGLAFCRLAIEAQEGKIWVENASDQGAVFYFTLPIAGPRQTHPQK